MNKKVLSVVLAVVCASILLVPLIAYATFFARSTPKRPAIVAGSEASTEQTVEANESESENSSEEIALGTPLIKSLTKNTESTKGSDMVKLITDHLVIGIIIGGIILLVLIVLIIVLLTSGSKKEKVTRKKEKEIAQPVQIQNAPVYPVKEAVAVPAVESQSSETTVLWDGPSDNVFLGRLTRRKDGRSVVINKDCFAIGKDIARNDYSIPDNSAVSRSHATIKQVGSDVVIEDNFSTNGTFINGVRVMKGQTATIKNGDVIMLADETFDYNTLIG